jgi:hypothetical protein
MLAEAQHIQVVAAAQVQLVTMDQQLALVVQVVQAFKMIFWEQIIIGVVAVVVHQTLGHLLQAVPVVQVVAVAVQLSVLLVLAIPAVLMQVLLEETLVLLEVTAAQTQVAEQVVLMVTQAL